MTRTNPRKGKTKVEKRGIHSLYLLEITKQKSNSDLENLISLKNSVILYIDL